MKIVLIDWVDSAGESGWVSSRDVENTIGIAQCQTVGFLVKETKEFITLALSRAKDSKHFPYGDIISIPKVCITKQEVIGGIDDSTT